LNSASRMPIQYTPPRAPSHGGPFINFPPRKSL
jgi:hypothetical protein